VGETKTNEQEEIRVCGFGHTGEVWVLATPSRSLSAERRRGVASGSGSPLELVPGAVTEPAGVEASDLLEGLTRSIAWLLAEFPDRFPGQRPVLVKVEVVRHSLGGMDEGLHHFCRLVVPEIPDHVLMLVMPVRRSKFEEQWEMFRPEAERLAGEKRRLRMSGVSVSEGLTQQS
jgi:hypothetical protein